MTIIVVAHADDEPSLLPQCIGWLLPCFPLILALGARMGLRAHKSLDLPLQRDQWIFRVVRVLL